MSSSSGSRAVRLAEVLGVIQEARRLHHSRVGSEHVLMATCSDPVVRVALAKVGCDMSDVQRLVTQAAPVCRPDTPTPQDLTATAADVITRAAAGFDDLDLSHTPDPRLFSMLLGLMMITLLRDEQDSAAGRVLDELGLRQHAHRLATSIERTSGSAVLPQARSRAEPSPRRIVVPGT